MNIISHRGYWKKEAEKNTVAAFIRSFELGFGTETDLRDLDGDVVISHDIPRYSDSPITMEEFIKLYSEYGKGLPLALNVKSDGLQEQVRQILKNNSIENYYLFDMSIPDMIMTKKYDLQFLTRVSDVEKVPVMLNESAGVWLDEFHNEWIDVEIIKDLTNLNKKVFIVSPDLHKRDYKKKWSSLKEQGVLGIKDVYLCTDFPEDAKTYFGEKL